MPEFFNPTDIYAPASACSHGAAHRLSRRRGAMWSRLGQSPRRAAEGV